MNKQSLFLTLLCVASLSTCATARNMGDIFDEFEEHIEQNFKQMQQSLQRLRSYQPVSLEEAKEGVTVTIKNIGANDINAHLNDANSRLTITTPTDKIIIETMHNIINIQTRTHQAPVEEQKQATKPADKEESKFFESSISSIARTVGGKLALDKQTIDYNADTKELIITIPFQQEPKGRTIPINKRTAAHTADSTSPGQSPEEK